MFQSGNKNQNLLSRNVPSLIEIQGELERENTQLHCTSTLCQTDSSLSKECHFYLRRSNTNHAGDCEKPQQIKKDSDLFRAIIMF